MRNCKQAPNPQDRNPETISVRQIGYTVAAALLEAAQRDL
jgi:hypothetical protein